MSEQDKPVDAQINLTSVFEKIIYEYESGNLENIKVSIDCGLKNPKYEVLQKDLETLKKNSVPLDVVMGMYETLKDCADHTVDSWTKTAKAKKYVEKFEAWKKENK